MGSTKKIFILVALFVALLLYSSGEITAQDRTGVTESEILIGFITSLTGPAAYGGLGVRDGFQLGVDEINSTGGVNGRKLNVIVSDDGCNAAKAIAATKRMIMQDKVFVLAGGGCTNASLTTLPIVTEAKVPYIFMPVSHEGFTKPFNRYSFRSGQITMEYEPTSIVDLATKELKAKRIAIISAADEYGTSGADGVIGVLKRNGMTPVAREIFNMGDTDFSSQILNLKKANPEVTILYGYTKEAGIIVRQAKEMGLKTQWIGSSAITTPMFPTASGEAGVGVISVYGLPNLEESSAPPVAEFQKKFKEKYPMAAKGRPNYFDLIGYGSSKVVQEGLKRAGRDLTREGFISALETLKNFETGVIFPTTFTPTDHQGNKFMRFLQILPSEKRNFLDYVWRAPH